MFSSYAPYVGTGTFSIIYNADGLIAKTEDTPASNKKITFKNIKLPAISPGDEVTVDYAQGFDTFFNTLFGLRRSTTDFDFKVSLTFQE